MDKFDAGATAIYPDIDIKVKKIIWDCFGMIAIHVPSFFDIKMNCDYVFGQSNLYYVDIQSDNNIIVYNGDRKLTLPI